MSIEHLLKSLALQKSLSTKSFAYKGGPEYFRVELGGIGYAQGPQVISFKECQKDVEALMKTPEYLAAEERFLANAEPVTDIVRGEDGNWVLVETGPAKFRPKFYEVANAWIHDETQRGRGFGKIIYRAFIFQAIEYSRSSGGVFVGPSYCSLGSGTSAAARRVWKSITRDFTSSGDVIFVGL